jgi:hypothetical protein
MKVQQQIIMATMLLFAMMGVLFLLQGDSSGKATTSTTARIVDSIPYNCSVLVDTGYNQISLPCITVATISTLTGNVSVEAVYQYVPGASDPWKVYNPNLPSYVTSDLSAVTRRNGYIVIMNGPANLSFNGLRVSSTDVPLVAGWNLVGYPSIYVRNASTTFSAINGFVEAVAYNKTPETFINYPGTLSFVEPGYGYWIYSNNGSAWTVTS